MCLYTITKRHEKPSKKERMGWKVFKQLSGRPRDAGSRRQFGFVHQTYRGKSNVDRGKWLNAERPPSDLGTEYDWLNRGARYPAGFHAFATREAARAAINSAFARAVVRVRLRGVETEGTQWGHRVLVAREMFVPRPKVKK